MNQLTKVDNTAYKYDAAGNLTKDGTYSYSWDYENRLTKVKLVSDSSDVAEYTYDALGRRVEKIDHTGESAVTTRWYQDRWSAIEERDGDDALQATYVNGPRIDEYLVMVRAGNTSWYCQSPIVGNVVALLDSTGAVKEGYTYRAYGQAIVHTGSGDDETWFSADDPTATSSSIGNPYLFTGREWDEDISLQYNRARWYAPAPGRWLSRDPLGYRDGFNLYEYVLSNGPRYDDHKGLAVDVEWFKQSWGKHAGHEGLIVGGQTVDYGPAGHWPYPPGLEWLGVCPYEAGPKLSELHPTQLKDGIIEAGPKTGLRCCKASTAIIHQCIWAVCAEWNGTTFLVGPLPVLRHNCWDFVTEALGKCCLRKYKE